jgi:hypothetical protein
MRKHEKQAMSHEEVAASKKPSAGMSRREFARRAALASAVASWAPAGAISAGLAHAPQTAGSVARDANEQAASATQTTPASSATAAGAQQNASLTPQKAANLPKLSPESQAEVDARLQAILGQYGARFSDEQKTDLQRLCTVVQPPLDRLRAYTVSNGEGPGLYLKPLVEREKKPAAAPRSSSIAPAAGGAAKKP